MSRLANTKDGILVSKETITDYSLNPGDLLRLRVPTSAPESSTSSRSTSSARSRSSLGPRDSFMVANLPYLLPATGAPGPNEVFAKASGSPTAVAARVAAATAPLGATVKNVDQQAVQTVSSITDVDMKGISHIEEAFAIALAAAAMGCSCSGDRRAPQRARRDGRRRSGLREVGAFVWSESGARPRRFDRPRRRAGLADGPDAGDDADPRLRPAAGPPCDSLGVPGCARRCGGSRGRRSPRARGPAAPAVPLGELLRER